MMDHIWHRRAALNTPWNPWMAGGVLLRLDGDHVVPYDATYISQITDQGPGLKHATQATPARMHPWTAADAEFGGHGSFGFIDRYSDIALALSGSYSVYLVGKFGSAAQYQHFVANVDGTKSVVAVAPTGNTALYSGALLLDPTDSRNKIAVIAGIFDGMSSRIYTSKSTPTTGNAGANGAAALKLGAMGATGTLNPVLGKGAMLDIFSGADSPAVAIRKLRYYSDKFKQVFT